MSSELGLAPGIQERAKIKPMTTSVLEKFIKHNRIRITDGNLKGRCVDGRYYFDNPDEFPVVSKPGGTAGDLMIAFGALNLLGLSLPGDRVLQAVLEVVGGPEKFCFHTDSHAESAHSGCGRGCGHLKFALENPEAYKLSADQINFIFNQLEPLLKQSAQQVVLQGDHAESAVVIVDSEEYGLKPMWQHEGILDQVFVYQKTLHTRQLDKLARKLQEALAEQGDAVEESDIRLSLDQAFAFQIGATLSRIAKGLPIYSVSLAADEIQIQ